MIYEIESTTVKGTFYEVDTINLTCTCKGFQYKGWCKHLKDKLQQLSEEADKKVEEYDGDEDNERHKR